VGATAGRGLLEQSYIVPGCRFAGTRSAFSGSAWLVEHAEGNYCSTRELDDGHIPQFVAAFHGATTV